MRACTRNAAPPLLAAHAEEIGRSYAERKRREPAFRFSWPTTEGLSLFAIAQAALVEMTNNRCAYCDGFPIDAHGEEQIDHFRPKSDPRFYELVCTWTNLFLSCMKCNKSKGARWDDALLRPDDAGYRFERYFEYRTDTGELRENPAASPEDQRRATRTIEILGLNRAGLCIERRRMMRQLRGGVLDEDDQRFRYLAPLVTSLDP